MTVAEIEGVFAMEGLTPWKWDEEANHFFPAHTHESAKLLFCVEGAVTFHLADGDVKLGPGMRMDLPAGTQHSATVGPHGVVCMEAYRS